MSVQHEPRWRGQPCGSGRGHVEYSIRLLNGITLRALLIKSEDVIAATRRWLEKSVIGLNLCPFAESVYRAERVRFCVSEQRSASGLLEDLRVELNALQAADPSRSDHVVVHVEVDEALTKHDSPGAPRAGMCRAGPGPPQLLHAGGRRRPPHHEQGAEQHDCHLEPRKRAVIRRGLDLRFVDRDRRRRIGRRLRRGRWCR